MIKFIDPAPPPANVAPKPRPAVKAPPVPPVEKVSVAPAVEEPKVPAPEPVKHPAPAAPIARHHAKPTETSTKTTTDLAPGVTATTDSVQAELEASPAFRTFVADAKISGVYQGTPARAFINGRLVRAGEILDSSLGIRFDSVEPSTKSIVFKDVSGAKVTRRY
ncbi:MAG: hypothetical protein JWM88_3387 [Verrucomicrobia bacterium]|nr:hypothetical protein [Verrucomicrobiota bacterium]